MSEYLSKKAVLESISEAYQTSLEDSDQADWEEGYRSALRFVKRTIQSGAFDAPEMEHINDYWAREGLIKHQEAEVQRLRAENERYRKALERIAETDIPYAPMTDHSVIRFYEQVAREALASTPTEPSTAERDITEVYVVRNRYKDILYVGLEWNEVEELLAQDASYEYLSYGINIPEGEDKHEHQ